MGKVIIESDRYDELILKEAKWDAKSQTVAQYFHYGKRDWDIITADEAVKQIKLECDEKVKNAVKKSTETINRELQDRISELSAKGRRLAETNEFIKKQLEELEAKSSSLMESIPKRKRFWIF